MQLLTMLRGCSVRAFCVLTLRISSILQGAAPEQEPAEHSSLWENKIKTWMERYEEASSNQYSEDVQLLLRVKEQGDGKSLAYNTHPASFKPPVEVKQLSTSTIRFQKSTLLQNFFTS